MSDVPELTTSNFDESTKQGVTLIDFWAEWCGPCRMISPIMDELAGEYDGKAKMGKVNIDDEADLAVRFKVQSIPTILVVKDGEEASRFIGVTPKSDLAAAIDAAIG